MIITEPSSMAKNIRTRPVWSRTWGKSRIRNDQNAKIPIVTATE
jgi:hypothetical protein